MEQAIPTPSAQRYSPAEYREICERTDQLLDYWDGVITDRAGKPIKMGPQGEVLDMAGADPNHGRIAANVGREVGNRLKGGPCEVLDSSVQVCLGSVGRRHAHPDVTVCCEPLQMDADSPAGPAVLNPTMVVEVLSPTTQNYDRNEKADGYRDIESLREYVLVWQDRPQVRTFYRSVDGVWSFGPTVTDLAASVQLRSIGVDLPLSEIYARVMFPPTATPVADRGA